MPETQYPNVIADAWREVSLLYQRQLYSCVPLEKHMLPGMDIERKHLANE